jgi:hypothetical protein
MADLLAVLMRHLPGDWTLDQLRDLTENLIADGVSVVAPRPEKHPEKQPKKRLVKSTALLRAAEAQKKILREVSDIRLVLDREKLDVLCAQAGVYLNALMKVFKIPASRNHVHIYTAKRIAYALQCDVRDFATKDTLLRDIPPIKGESKVLIDFDAVKRLANAVGVNPNSLEWHVGVNNVTLKGDLTAPGAVGRRLAHILGCTVDDVCVRVDA